MAQYIDKDALLAEIERLYDEEGAFYAADVLYDLKEYLDTLEVKEIGVDLGDPKGDKSAKHIIDTIKEVDLTEEIDFYIKSSLTGTNPIYTKGAVSCIVEKTAKHFFELGLKAQKGE